MIFYGYERVYVVKFLLLSDADKSPAIASKITNEVLIILEHNLCMKPRYELISDGYFIAAVAAHHPALALKGVVVGLEDLTLFDNEFVFFGFASIWMCWLPFDLTFQEHRILFNFHEVGLLFWLDGFDQWSRFEGHGEFVGF